MDPCADELVGDNFEPILVTNERDLTPCLKQLIGKHVSPGETTLVTRTLIELGLTELPLIKASRGGNDNEFVKEYVGILKSVFKEEPDYPAT